MLKQPGNRRNFGFSSYSKNSQDAWTTVVEMQSNVPGPARVGVTKREWAGTQQT